MSVSSPETSLSLLDQLRDPEAAQAWDRLATIYTSLLQTWFHTAGLQSADCDDLTQRVLEVLLRRMPTFEHNGRPGAFRAWLRSICVNLREVWRRRPGENSGSVLNQIVDPRSSLSQLWDKQHDQHVLCRLLELVEPEFAPVAWQAFRRLALDGAPAHEVAAELQSTVNSGCRDCFCLRWLFTRPAVIFRRSLPKPSWAMGRKGFQFIFANRAFSSSLRSAPWMFPIQT